MIHIENSDNEETVMEEIIIHVESMISLDNISINTNDNTNNSDDNSNDNSIILYETESEEYDSDDNESELDEECEKICMDETEFMDSDKIEKKYYIGFSMLMNAKYILDTAITPKSFFKYRYECVMYYLDGYLKKMK